MDGSRHALVVANDAYSDPGLRQLVAPARDAAALAEALADPAVGDFEVRVLHNESAQSIRLAVEDFFADRAPQDLLLLHFSCHGLKNAAGELFLAVADTRPTRLASTAVAADFVNRQMADSRAQRIALFLDCCYGGAFPRGMVVRAAGEAQVRDAFAGQEGVRGGRGRVVVTASSAMEYAFEGGHLATGADVRPSVFTGAVVEGLTTGEADRDGDGWVGLTELVGFVTDRVHRVTPHQTPQMWTFGSQGELLIARSRIRRITPTPLPAPLLEAMDSPLAATRFGVVDELRERLHDTDLGQAYAAWQALRRMVDDDSRKVSDAAQRCVTSAVPRVSPEVLDLGAMPLGTPAVGELRLEGPSLALTATASASAPWLRVEQTGAVVRVTAEPADAGQAEGAVVLQGPTGERTVPVRLQVTAPEQLPALAPEPEPELEPAVAPPPAAAPEHVAAPEPVAAPVGTPPWWLVAVLTVGALILIALNWPGDFESRFAWHDESTGWQVFRTPQDPYILASFLALAGALAARWSGRRASIPLGIVGGCAAFLAVDGTVFLAGRLAYDDELGKWTAAVVVAAGIVAIVLRVVRPAVRPLWPVNRPGLAVVITGAVLVLVGEGLTYDGVSFLRISEGAGLLGPLAVVALAWPALAAAGDSASRTLFVSTAVTYILLGIVDAVPAATNRLAASFSLEVAGYLLVLAGVAVAVRRPIRLASGQPAQPPTVVPEPAAARSWWQLPWVTAVGIGACAVLLLYLNWRALADGQKLWYDEDDGSPEQYREWHDGSLFAAFVALAAAATVWRSGRVASFGLGVVAGAGGLFATAAVVIIGGGLAYDEGVSAWSQSLVVAALMVALALAEAGRRARSMWFRLPDVASGTLLVLGFVVLALTQVAEDDNGATATSYAGGFALLLPLVAAGLVLLAAMSTSPDGYRIACGAAAAYLMLVVLASIYPIGDDVAPTYFKGMLVGHLILLAALVPGVIRRSRQGPTDLQGRERSDST